MAFLYGLGLATDVPSADVLDLIKQFVGGETSAPNDVKIRPELTASVKPAAEQERIMYLEDWGLDVRVSVVFLLDMHGDPDRRWEAAGLMSVAAAQLAVSLDIDAGMSFQYERRLLQRRSGVLTLFDWWPQWAEPSVQAKLPKPFELTGDDGHY